MPNAIIIHGKANHTKYFDSVYASPSNASWLPWLQKQLLMNGILTQTPEMPVPWKPDYASWCEEFERYDITSRTMLIGHSFGAGFIVRWLCEHPNIHVGKVILVAPFIDPLRDQDTGTFFDFKIDAQLSERTEKLILFSSSNDFPNAQRSAQNISDAVPGAIRREFEQYGHFTEIIEFTVLRDELLATA